MPKIRGLHPLQLPSEQERLSVAQQREFSAHRNGGRSRRPSPNAENPKKRGQHPNESWPSPTLSSQKRRSIGSVLRPI